MFDKMMGAMNGAVKPGMGMRERAGAMIGAKPPAPPAPSGATPGARPGMAPGAMGAGNSIMQSLMKRWGSGGMQKPGMGAPPPPAMPPAMGAPTPEPAVEGQPPMGAPPAPPMGKPQGGFLSNLMNRQR